MGFTGGCALHHLLLPYVPGCRVFRIVDYRYFGKKSNECITPIRKIINFSWREHKMRELHFDFSDVQESHFAPAFYFPENNLLHESLLPLSRQAPFKDFRDVF